MHFLCVVGIVQMILIKFMKSSQSVDCSHKFRVRNVCVCILIMCFIVGFKVAEWRKMSTVDPMSLSLLAKSMSL